MAWLLMRDKMPKEKRFIVENGNITLYSKQFRKILSVTRGMRFINPRKQK